MPIYPDAIIDPPAHEPTRYGLMSVARVISTELNDDGTPVQSDGEPRWQGGITFAPDSCAEAFPWSMACEVPPDDPDDPNPRQKEQPPENPDAVVQTATEIYLPFRCSSFGWQATDYKERTRRIYDAAEGKAIEREFWTGEAGSPQSLMGSTLLDEDHVLNPDGTPDNPTPVSVISGLVLLSEALSNCGAGGRGMIHLPPGPGEVAFAAGAIKDPTDDNEPYLVNGRGDIAVIGAGYTGWGPTGNPDYDPETDEPEDAFLTPEAPAPGTAWIFATRLVEVRHQAPMLIPTELSEAFDRATNTVTFYAEGLAMAYHDGCCSFAVLVNYID